MVWPAEFLKSRRKITPSPGAQPPAFLRPQETLRMGWLSAMGLLLFFGG
jgi:hypothetical protein